MDVNFYKGDLIRWMTGHSEYEAHDDTLVGKKPIYSYGFVIEVSAIDPDAIIVNSCVKSGPVKLTILNDGRDEVEILSGARNNG